MSIYYNPQKLRARRWIIATFISVPILLVVITFIIGQKKAKEQSTLKKEWLKQQEKIDLNKLL